MQFSHTRPCVCIVLFDTYYTVNNSNIFGNITCKINKIRVEFFMVNIDRKYHGYQTCLFVSSRLPSEWVSTHSFGWPVAKNLSGRDIDFSTEMALLWISASHEMGERSLRTGVRRCQEIKVFQISRALSKIHFHLKNVLISILDS